ncbi:hypothetical protein FFLO_03519 [Filobasidium floriforme]|uniref:Uncharacterized protein n=1 Tax=Filobasidium floriforme TaxID=5210 RepID=A0A8K0JLZ8_9TREE|nr:uncharacterized protein HD553DRAFT_324140 [Filobasidium floriforme]KAG7535999.1 hypothetical protein FFLO_03519 [Filobasidium floriforme]KAH8084830.1 hypothetical protein HD553DRAFT_324140 [Filobasidium floriforme]
MMFMLTGDPGRRPYTDFGKQLPEIFKQAAASIRKSADGLLDLRVYYFERRLSGAIRSRDRFRSALAGDALNRAQCSTHGQQVQKIVKGTADRQFRISHARLKINSSEMVKRTESHHEDFSSVIVAEQRSKSASMLLAYLFAKYGTWLQGTVVGKGLRKQQLQWVMRAAMAQYHSKFRTEDNANVVLFMPPWEGNPAAISSAFDMSTEAFHRSPRHITVRLHTHDRFA